MRRSGRFGAILSLAAVAVPGAVRAESDPRLTGLWTLVSYEVEVRADGSKAPVMGEKPTGYAYFTPENRLFFVLTGEGRKPAGTEAQRAALEGERLRVLTPWRVMPNWADKGETRSIVTFVRGKD
jgi:hypothetical protein